MTDRAPTPIDTVVIGGGLAGLLAAVTAARAGATVRLLDAHPLGGRARCDDCDGFTFNRGPRALYVDGPADRALRALGLDTARGGPPQLAGAAAAVDGRLELLPQGPVTALRTGLLSWREKAAFARAYAHLDRLDPTTVAGRSVADWLDGERLAGRARQLLEALVRVATYTDAPEVFDAGAALANAKAGTSPGVRYLDGGWQTLVDELAALAWDAGVERHRVAAQAIGAPDPDGARTVRTADGDVRARTVVLAVGGPEAAATLLGGVPASWAPLGPPVTAACLELGVRRLPTRRFVLGIDRPWYLSTHAPPARLAPEGHAVVHLLRYQRPGDDVPAAAQQAELRGLAAAAGVAAGDIVTDRFLARMVVSGGLPTAAGGGLAGRPAVAGPEHPGVVLAGDWVGPEGLLLDAVAASALAAGRSAAARSATMAVA